MSETAAVAPSIEIADGYAKYADSFDFNMQSIATYLRDGGLDEDGIAETTIVFSDKLHPKDAKGSLRRTYGTYRDKKITLYALDELFEMYVRPSQASEMALVAATHKTLVHELEHRIADGDVVQTRQNNRYDLLYGIRKYSGWAAGTTAGAAALGFVSQEVDSPVETLVTAGGVAIAGIASCMLIRADTGEAARYYNHPEEKRCFTAEEQVSEHFVNIHLKESLVRPWMSEEEAEAMRAWYRADFEQSRYESQAADNVAPWPFRRIGYGQLIDFVLGVQRTE